MSRQKIDAIRDLDDPSTKRRLMSFIGTLRGWWEIKLEPRRDTRSLRANSYYHAEICAALSDFLRDQDWQQWHTGFAHRMLKEVCLKQEVLNPATGEVMTVTGSTTELTVEEFFDYVERCRAYLLKTFLIETEDPERDPVKRAARKAAKLLAKSAPSRHPARKEAVQHV